MASRLFDRDDIGSAPDSVAIDISSTDHIVNFRRLWVGGAGAVKIITAYGHVATYSGVPAGTYIHAQGSQVTKVGTTATLINAEL